MTYRDAIPVLADRLPEDLPWAVTASANLALIEAHRETGHERTRGTDSEVHR